MAGTLENDILVGGSGIDRLSGGSGNDLLAGGAGKDVLNGSDGDGRLIGGLGQDALIQAEARTYSCSPTRTPAPPRARLTTSRTSPANSGIGLTSVRSMRT
nr:hypothetical protein [Microvirga calopogonii]